MADRQPAPRPRATKAGNKVVIPESPESQVQRAIANLNAAEVNGGRPPVSGRAASRAAAAKKTKAPTNGAAPRKPEVHPEPEEFDIDKSIREMSREHIECRDLRHSWRPWSARWNAKGNYFEDILRCGRCESERIRRVNARGQLLDSHYDYAEGYVMVGAGRMTQDMNASLRLASLQTRLVKDTVQE